MENKYEYGRGSFKTIDQGNEINWLVSNGIGGYADCTICGGSAMSFNSYLIASFDPPVNRYSIFTRSQEEVIINNRKHDLTSQMYINESKNGQRYIKRFIFDDVPQYIYQVEDAIIKKTVCMEYGKNTTVVCYEIENGSEEMEFNITPLFNYRRAGEVSEKSSLKFKMTLLNKNLTLVPEENQNVKIEFMSSEGEFYDRSLIPTSLATPNYLIEEDNYYMIDNRTGFNGLDNHFTPYEVQVKINKFEKKKFFIKCTVDGIDNKDGFKIVSEYKERCKRLVSKANYNDTFADNLVKAADLFIVDRESTKLKTVLAGYPWFTDWGRDTMIAFEGLTLVTKRFEDAREILLSFVNYMKGGLIPNMFPDKDNKPLYNTVDASLWYFQAVYQYLKYTGNEEDYDFVHNNIYNNLVEIYEAYAKGTDFSIYMDEDCLIHAGSGYDQVTWMDVRVGDLVVTPRHGKPVEINALWYNAICILELLSRRFGYDSKTYTILKEKIKLSFNNKFWNEETKCLYDVVDDNDSSIRPNQLFAVSLPFTMLDRRKEKSIVDVVNKHLYSVYGLRSLSFMDDRFKKEYIGKLINRDKAYHMGTTWGYLIGPFITSYCKVNNYSDEAVNDAKEMLDVFKDHMRDGCINGIAEIFDGEFASTSRGCFSQAWSVAEVLRSYVNDVLMHIK